MTVRNSVLRGEGTPVGGGTGQMINIAGRPDNPVEFVTIFNNVISEGGDWSRDHSKDIHAIRPLYRARYIWILDNKNSYHVILSSNKIHDFGNARTGTAVILSNNDEGRYTGYHWAINNEIYDATGGAIRCSGDQRDEKTYAMGNYIHDVDNGFILAAHSGVSRNDEWVINNTIRNCLGRGILFPRGAGRNLVLRGDTTNDCWAHIEGRNKFANSELSYHLSYNSNVKKTRVSLRGFDVSEGNRIDGHPTDIEDSLRLSDPIYKTFKALYGVEIANITDRPW